MGTKLTLKLYQLVRSCWWCDAVLRSQCVIAKYIWNISFTTSQEICVSTDQTKHYLNYLFWVPVHYLLFIMTFLHSHKSWGMKHWGGKNFILKILKKNSPPPPPPPPLYLRPCHQAFVKNSFDAVVYNYWLKEKQQKEQLLGVSLCQSIFFFRNL